MRARDWVGHLLETCSLVGIDVPSRWQVDEELLAVLAEAIRAVPFERALLQLSLPELRPGMVLAVDACIGDGTLLLAHGHHLTAQSIERLTNHATTGTVRQPVTVVAP